MNFTNTLNALAKIYLIILNNVGASIVFLGDSMLFIIEKFWAKSINDLKANMDELQYMFERKSSFTSFSFSLALLKFFIIRCTIFLYAATVLLFLSDAVFVVINVIFRFVTGCMRDILLEMRNSFEELNILINKILQNKSIKFMRNVIGMIITLTKLYLSSKFYLSRIILVYILFSPVHSLFVWYLVCYLLINAMMTLYAFLSSKEYE